MKGVHKSWTSLAAFLLVMFFCLLADGLMEALGNVKFVLAGLAVMSAAWALVEAD